MIIAVNSPMECPSYLVVPLSTLGVYPSTVSKNKTIIVYDEFDEIPEKTINGGRGDRIFFGNKGLVRLRPIRKKLSQADSKKFIEGEYDEETGDCKTDDLGNGVHMYMGEQFYLTYHMRGANLLALSVRGKGQRRSTEAEVEPGAKPGTFTIRETLEMFRARCIGE